MTVKRNVPRFLYAVNLWQKPVSRSNDPNQYPSNGLPIWHGLPDIRPIEVNNG